MIAPPDGACTSLPSRPTLSQLQPILDGRQLGSCNYPTQDECNSAPAQAEVGQSDEEARIPSKFAHAAVAYLTTLAISFNPLKCSALAALPPSLESALMGVLELAASPTAVPQLSAPSHARCSVQHGTSVVT